MPIVPEGRFILVNMDRCQDLMGGGCSGTLHRTDKIPDFSSIFIHFPVIFDVLVFLIENFIHFSK